MGWIPDLTTKEEINGFVQDLLSTLPDQLGIDEVITGCEVLTFPAGAPPKYIDVALGGDLGPPQTGYTQAVLYRGGITGLGVGSYVAVIHLREGNRYEVLMLSGPAGAAVDPAPADAEYVTMALNASLTNERVLTAGDGIGLVDGGAGGNATLSVDCTDLLGAWIGEDAANNFRFQPDLPVVISAGGVVVEYATIQLAITAASDCETVLIPPGTWTEDITLKDGVGIKGFGPRAKVVIAGDEDIVTTADGGWLENVTIIATDPPAGGIRQAVNFAHAAGSCNLYNVSIIVNSTANAQFMHAINSTGTGASRLVLDNIDIDVTTTQAGSIATGIRADDDYVIIMKNYRIVVTNTGGGAGDDAYGMLQNPDAIFQVVEGVLGVGAAGAGVAYDLSGTILYSTLLTTANDTVFSGNIGVGTDTPAANTFGVNHRFVGIQAQAVDGRAVLELVSPDLTGGGTAGRIDIHNLDGGAAIVGRATIDGYRDGADDAMALRFMTKAAGVAVSTKVTILGNGDVGVGTPMPWGKLHGNDSIGGFLYWEYDGVGAAAQTIIPNAAGDVLYILGGYYMMRASDTSTSAAPVPDGLVPGTNFDMDPGAGVLTCAVAANGSVTVQRTGGALTYKVAFWLLWL